MQNLIKSLSFQRRGEAEKAEAEKNKERPYLKLCKKCTGKGQVRR